MPWQRLYDQSQREQWVLYVLGLMTGVCLGAAYRGRVFDALSWLQSWLP